MENNIELKENSAYQNSLIYIVLVMFGLLQIGMLAVAWGCYLPYSAFGFSIPNDLHRAFWTLVMIPGIVIILCLWMANMINKKLGHLSILLILLEGIFLLFIPKIYSNGSYNIISYFTSGFVFFLVFTAVSAVIWDLWGGKRASKKPVPIILAVVIILVLVFLCYYLVRLVVLSDFYPRVVICFMIPAVSAICFLVSILSAFSAVFSRGCIAIFWGSSALGTLLTAFEALNYRPLRLLFVVGLIVAVVVGIYDVYKFIIYKENEK